MKIITNKTNLECNVLTQNDEVINFPDGFEVTSKKDEISLLMNKKPVSLIELDIIGWNQTLKKFIRITGIPSKGKDFLSSINLNILDYESGLHIGYVQSMFIKVTDNKCYIIFERYERDIDNNKWSVVEYK